MIASKRFPWALVQSPVRFNRVPEKVPEKVWDTLVNFKFSAKPGKVQQGSGKGSGQGLGGFGAEPGHVQQGSGEGSGEPGQVQQDLRPYNSRKPS